MAETDDAELLFFDTFSHEVDTDINLDLVQFPKPVYITQVRIIPLGARVQADFPGGVRLGATNPSKFDIEFFVNDLGMPGASTFENLGQLKYNQNDCIHLECTLEKIPTDGLVLRGWYSTITLAVYGVLTNSLNEPIASPPPPCEPAGPEDICNLGSSDSRNASALQEDSLKEDWKEPLPGEVTTVHKSRASDYEREDLEYVALAERQPHYHHHSGDERERERRLRKTSHSSERSASSRNRTHSESNERDYTLRTRSERERDKPSRDWSRSPTEYGSRRARRRKRSERSRSDADEPHKWPRTPPPASIDSPTRPRSPDNMDYSECEDEEDDPAVAAHYKTLKSRAYLRSSESVTNTGAAVESHSLDDDDATPGTPGEQYEPILSDDEIIGDDLDEDSIGATEPTAVAADEFEIELEAAALAAGPAIIDFDAFKTPLAKFEGDLHFHYNKELENLRLLLKKYTLQTKCEGIAQFNNNNVTSVDERESFVYLSEQLINQLSYLAQNYKRRNFVLQQFFSDANHMEQAFCILRIALDFESACAQMQPAFKIRHMKVGAKLAELLLGANGSFIQYVINDRKYDPFAAVFTLYQQEYMALSIKLMLLKAVYALLDTRAGCQHFITNAKTNGYQLLLEMLQQSHLTRTKYALQAIIKKLHLYEALECVHENCATVFVQNCDQKTSEEHQVIEQAMTLLIQALAPSKHAIAYQQPKRFLPVSKKFEIINDAVAQRSYANALQAYFSQHGLGESLLLLFGNAAEIPMTLLLKSVELLQALLRSHAGVDYLVDDCFETTQLLVAVLLGIEDVPPVEEEDEDEKLLDVDMPIKQLKEEPLDELPVIQPIVSDAEPSAELDVDAIEKDSNDKASISPIRDEPSSTPPQLSAPMLHRLQRLGIELAYKVQTRYHLDAITFTATSNDYDANKLATHLHALYSQTCNTSGRKHTIEMLGHNNQLQVFMDLIKKEQRLQAQRQQSSPGAKYKSPVLSYAVDMVDCCVRYCEQLDYLVDHGSAILDLAKNHETFEPSVSAVLQEMFVYLKPLESINVFPSYDDITPLVDVINRSLEYITTFPGDLIMSLRILRYLVIPPTPHHSCVTEELKHRFVALQFYAADGMQTLIQILERLCVYFEQPGLHTPALMTTQGLHCCQIVLPTLQILRVLLSYAIQCRDVEFKDLTAIDHLLRTYFLLHYYPEGNAAASEVASAKQEIISILLAYTQPNEQDEESLHKSLWTQMVRELLRNIDAPSTFVPGLHVLAELLPLPLPLPLPSNMQLSDVQAQRLVTERKLWSAHLHPQSAQIVKLIETIVPTSFPQLSDLMARVCVQLADLAPNMTLLISKTLTDLICTEWTSSYNKPSALLTRLLHFFARLTTYASLKSSALSILSGRLWELIQTVLTQSEECNAQTLKCQAAIHSLLENFLDSEISLFAPQTVAATVELNLASALPPRELIPRIADSILINLLNVDVTHEVSLLAIRNLVILTEHDITFYHLSMALKQKRTEFQQWLHKIVTCNAPNTCHRNIESLVLLFCSLTQIEDLNSVDASASVIPTRTLKWSGNDLALAIGYQQPPVETQQPHLLQRIRALLEENKVSDATEALLNDIDRLILLLESRDASVNAEGEEESVSAPAGSEPALPQAESIVMQYVSRPIFMLYDAATMTDDQLRVNYWLEPLRMDLLSAEDLETQCERITCDLTELANSCLSPETNLTSDCKRVLHLSASPQSNRERTPTAPCFRTRRVEVEPSTGRPEKKLYITPVRGRGFPRPPPTRGDPFRSRPPNTSRPPSLHVDDFLALETCGAQPTGPTGYNKIPPLMRGSRVGRNRGSRISAVAAYRKTKVLRTSSPSTWNESGSPSQLYRTATAEPHFGSEPYGSHYGGRPRGRGSRLRSYLR